MKLKHTVIFTSFVLLVLAALFIWKNSTTLDKNDAQTSVSKSSDDPEYNSELKQSGQDALNENKTETIFQNIENSYNTMANFCRTRYPEQMKLIPSEEEIKDWFKSGLLKRSWINVHLKTADNTVIRIRRFSDDGPNGTVEKLVVFKEDDTGFPEIVDIPEQHKLNPTQEIIDQYLDLGESIFTDEGFTGDSGQKNIFLELINGQVTRVDVSEGASFLNCQSDY